MPNEQVKGTNLYYEDYGEGPAVILTPAAGLTATDSALWQPCYRPTAG